MANTYDDCIDTHSGVVGLEAPLKFVDLNSNRDLVGAIELNKEESFLVVQALCGNLGMDDATCIDSDFEKKCNQSEHLLLIGPSHQSYHFKLHQKVWLANGFFSSFFVW